MNFDFCQFSYAQEEKQGPTAIKEPVTINGDTVEYSTDNKEATAVGNVLITYKGTKLTCEKIKINTETKDAEAIGNVRLEDKKGVIEGDKIIYNFQNKTGIIINSKFRSTPFFGKAEKSDKVSDDEFIAYRGYITTCSYDHPHYRMKSRKVNFFPGDKVQLRAARVSVGQERQIPLAYLPQYSHSLKDPLMHVQLMPGKTKDWGYYMLSAWRCNLTENVRGRIYFDYRNRLGPSEGFGANYTSKQLGKGDFKYYYTHERSRDFKEGEPAEFQRYLIHWRHKWDIDKQTNAIVEYYKIADSKTILYPAGNYNFLKEYFFREYEKDAKPLSYVLLHRTFKYSGIDFLMQKRVNRWYDQVEKLPEIKYTMPSLQLGNSPFYFENTSSYLNYNYKYAVPAPGADDASENRDVSYNRYDTTNKLSLPTKVAFIKLTPFISGRDTYTDKSTYGATSEVVFSAGADASTKFYRLFEVKSNFLGLNINNLRHIITPSVAYSHNKTSIMTGSKAKFGGGATIGNSSAVLSLSNKLQTKRKGQSVDLADFIITTTYNIKPKSRDDTHKTGSSLSDFVFDLKLRPYTWLDIDADATYKHSDKYGANYRHFSDVNYDLNFNFAKERSFAIGQRYLRKSSNEITCDLKWRLTPKWLFSIYQRRNMGECTNLKKGLLEQEYTISRDLHCWTMDMTYNVKEGHGESIWLIFRLKAFPELEFEFNQSYHAPKSGAQ